MKVLTNPLRTLLLVMGVVFLMACKDQKNVTFTSPENRVKLHSELSWPDKSYLVIAYHDVKDNTATNGLCQSVPAHYVSNSPG